MELPFSGLENMAEALAFLGQSSRMTRSEHFQRVVCGRAYTQGKQQAPDAGEHTVRGARP